VKIWRLWRNHRNNGYRLSNQYGLAAAKISVINGENISDGGES